MKYVSVPVSCAYLTLLQFYQPTVGMVIAYYGDYDPDGLSALAYDDVAEPG